MKTVKTVQEGDFLEVKFNRPSCRNALNQEMIFEIHSLFRSIKKEDKIKCVVLSGEGKSFCAGADLNYMKSMSEYSFLENLKDSYKLFDMFKAIYDSQIPVICEVKGHVMGGGLGFLGVSDFVFSEKETKFCFSEVKLALAPSIISSFVLSRMHSQQHFLLTGKVFSSEEASLCGLIDQVGNEEEIKMIKESVKTHISQASRVSLVQTKKLLRSFQKKTPFWWWKRKFLTANLISQLRVGKDAQERMKKFLNKKNENK